VLVLGIVLVIVFVFGDSDDVHVGGIAVLCAVMSFCLQTAVAFKQLME
jgi:hypothetical protein